MDGPIPVNTSGTARLLLGGPAYAVGWQEPVYLPNPAAGATWKFTVDGRYHTRVISIRWGYAASGVVVNRFPMLTLRDANGTIVFRSPAMQQIIAGNNLAMNSYRFGYTDFAQNQAEQFSGLPDVLLPPGWSWSGDVVNIDAGDQISGVVLLVQRYPNDTLEIPAAV